MASQLEQDHEDLPAADYERDSPKMEDSKEVNLNDAPSDDVESKKSVTEFEEGPMVPKRVRLALEEARTLRTTGDFGNSASFICTVDLWTYFQKRLKPKLQNNV